MRLGKTTSKYALAAACLVLAVQSTRAFAGDQYAAIVAASGWLNGDKTTDANGAYWTDPADHNGYVAAGLVRAYQVTGNGSYLSLATDAGDHIIWNYNNVLVPANLNYDCAEVYALSRLAPYSATYSNAVSNWLGTALPGYAGGAPGFANAVVAGDGADMTSALVHLAYYSVAAQNMYVASGNTNATFLADENAFHKIINVLGLVNDHSVLDTGPNHGTNNNPTKGLAAAVWALANTPVGLDGTVISGGVLNGKALSDLPSVLASRMIVTTIADGGAGTSMDYTIGHTIPPDPANDFWGFAEDSAIAILALDAAQTSNPGFDYTNEIFRLRDTLANSIDLGAGGQPGIDIIATADPGFAAFDGGATLDALVPEPSSIALLGLGAVGLLARRRRVR